MEDDPDELEEQDEEDEPDEASRRGRRGGWALAGPAALATRFLPSPVAALAFWLLRRRRRGRRDPGR